MGKFGSAVKNAGEGLNWLFVIGFLGVVWFMIYGNLAGNLGFNAGSQADNDTQLIINNLTEGGKAFYALSPVLFKIIGIVLLITILLSLLYVVMKIVDMGKNKGTYSQSSY